MELTLEVEPSSQDIEFLNREINEFNLSQADVPFDGELSYFERDANGEIRAGVYGWTWGGCCEIRYLWVHAELRGQGHGTRLMQAAEQEAVRRGCTQVVLDTHSFQAPDFYRKLGYEIFGTVSDYPLGHQKLYLWKHF